MKKTLTIATILGARPQFIKSPIFSAALKQAGWNEILIHTGQHYDFEMSEVFFQEMKLRKPDYDLGVGSASQGAQTGRMLEGIEKILLKDKPDWVVVFGDTNSTLAGALAAVKLGIPLAHVEAGLRSYNRTMPEEINRVLTDHVAQLLFCPSLIGKKNLAKEGIRKGVVVTGDIMVDTLREFLPLARQKKTCERYGLAPKEYLLLTIHRPGNTDSPENMENIFSACGKIQRPIIFPVHPRTQEIAGNLGERYPNIIFTEPVGYLDMLSLVEQAQAILTDSGGLQKEALYLKTPCITLRQESEWPETCASGWNQVVGTHPQAIIKAWRKTPAIQRKKAAQPYGRGDAAKKMIAAMRKYR